MDLAAARHHSSGTSTKKVVEREAGGGGARHARCSMGKTLLLAEPAPQERLEAAARASEADGLPTVALRVLAGSAGEPVDSGALSFLLKQQLSAMDVVEEEEEKVEKEEVKPGPESVEWVQLCAPRGKTYFWNRRTQFDLLEPSGPRREGGLLQAQGQPCQLVRPPSSSSWVTGAPPHNASSRGVS